MAAVSNALRRLSRRPAPWALAALLLAAGPRTGQTQLDSVHLTGPATKLLSVTYFEPPDDQKVKVRLSGAEMVPLPNSLFDVKQLTVEQFSLGGKVQARVMAPECQYAPLDAQASSAGHLHLELGDGRITVEGDGFFWRQNDNSLDISNNVITLIRSGTWKFLTP